MKKILAIICAIAMVCSLAAVVSAAETTTLWEGTATGGGNWWDLVLEATVDGTAMTENGYISIYTDKAGNLNLILTGEKNGWAQIKPEHEGYVCEEADGGYVTKIPYATMLAVYDEYGATDLSDVTKLTIYSSLDSAVTVTKIEYSATPMEKTEEEETEAIATLKMGEEYAVSVSQWLPGYQPGDEVTITVEMKSNVFFNGTVGVNTADGWATCGQYDSVNNKATVTWTCVPDGDFLVQVWWTNEGSTGVEIKSITITKAEEEATTAPTTATTAPTTAPTTGGTQAPTVKPEDTNQKTGDPITMVVAMMAVSAMGITVLGKKKH